jgi:arginyl-tRNA--protein-N-Asp/Glu arginylyltransferase
MELENEIFTKVKGHENYSISNRGKVRNDTTNKIMKLSNSNGYKVVSLNCKQCKVHRLVANAFIPNPQKKEYVDHINNDKTDNIVSNLRWATNMENQHNSRLCVNNTSGYKGVNRHNSKWRAQIRHNGKKIDIGHFDNIEDAIEARAKKANELFGEYTNACEKRNTANLNITLPVNTDINLVLKVDEPKNI